MNELAPRTPQFNVTVSKKNRRLMQDADAYCEQHGLTRTELIMEALMLILANHDALSDPEDEPQDAIPDFLQ